MARLARDFFLFSFSFPKFLAPPPVGGSGLQFSRCLGGFSRSTHTIAAGSSSRDEGRRQTIEIEPKKAFSFFIFFSLSLSLALCSVPRQILRKVNFTAGRPFFALGVELTSHRKSYSRSLALSHVPADPLSGSRVGCTLRPDLNRSTLAPPPPAPLPFALPLSISAFPIISTDPATNRRSFVTTTTIITPHRFPTNKSASQPLLASNTRFTCSVLHEVAPLDLSPKPTLSTFNLRISFHSRKAPRTTAKPTCKSDPCPCHLILRSPLHPRPAHEISLGMAQQTL